MFIYYVKADLLGNEAATCNSQVQNRTAAPPRTKRGGIDCVVLEYFCILLK